MGIPIETVLARLTPEQRARVEARAQQLLAEEMTLRELRKAQARSQKDMARKLGIKQASISNIEARTDMLLSTLRNYVRAMGGDLTLTVSFPDRAPVSLTSLSQGGNTKPKPSRRLPRVKSRKAEKAA